MAQVRLLLFVACFRCFLPSIASAAPAPEDEWLNALYEEIARDLVRAKPLVVQVHVPLCDSNIIRCGNERLGDGNNPSTNLYWSTSGGFKGWFKTVGGWKRVAQTTSASGPILERIVWRKTVGPTSNWRSRGVRKRFNVYVVAFAWRGDAISQAIDQYVDDLYGATATEVVLKDGTQLQAGGAAHVVDYVGHNGWMDIPPYDWKRAAAKQARRKKATIAVACLTADYLAKPVSDTHRVPLLMTTSLLFAGAHSFEGAVSAFANGNSLAQIRNRAVKNYARGQKKLFRRVRGGFTNPSDKRWRRYVGDGRDGK